ncbi:SH3 domain-containing protein [Leptospira paudalimensis]|uniref:SH3 domain-containing protein n=1 Tax=Leptospira paudalimensis TaxID=2950024 RepID=A0ABT3M3D2_9LEPT|nr:SH3 domain-containing protein [Leptospira paudalimensis]MCW7502896.1 SH3 domain-containing protein [Leptospira paudalimensis]
MNKQKFFFIILFLFIVNELIPSPSKEELIEAWNRKLSTFYIAIPNELRTRFLTEGLGNTGIAYEHKNFALGISKERFPGEDINYSIGIQRDRKSNYDSQAYLDYWFKDDTLIMIVNTEPYIHNTNNYDFGGYRFRGGLALEFRDNQLYQMSCLHKPNNQKDVLDIFKKQYCGEKIEVNSDLEVVNVFDTKEKCTTTCKFGYHYRFPGTYITMGSLVNVRSTPSLNGEILAKLPRGEKVEVLEDTGKRDILANSIVLSNWLKVKTNTGIEGFIHGAYLRTPGEIDIYEIKRKAEEWKKANSK